MCLQPRDTISEEDVIPFQIAVHDGEKNLKEQVDGVDQHRQQEQPRFSRHHGGIPSGRAGDCLADEEARRGGKRQGEEEAKDCFLSASGLVLLKLRHELRFRRGVQEGGELGNLALALVGGSWTGQSSCSWRVAAAYQGMTKDEEQGAKDARWPQAGRANGCDGRRFRGGTSTSRFVGERQLGEEKLVTSPGISGDTWARFWQRQPSQPARICGPVLGCGD
ncbi:uncharacterized protein Triagg1_9219 [Trichoderma aggressivum f. europaeum]|uniref:Uncharacterized protein n=1 Tax=Trichoderma aggressivum f. europaeum TaxID=173218 RepID=A0AAE1I8U0_9HYPO|nr:hypothetical protein Triagg1_9219 [Trichoderma aggressivum f. europaeum]